MWMRMFLALTLALLGCSHRVTRPQLTNRTDRSLVIMTDSMPGGTFPQITDPARAWSHGSLIAASDAPLCVPDLKSRALTWDEVQAPIESRYLKAVALRLPPGFTPAWYSHPRDPDEQDSEELADSGKYWGHMLGSWDRFDATSAGSRPSGFTIWIGPEEGYPSWYIGGAEVRQVSFSECRVETAIGLLPIALFAVESPEPMIGGYVVVTYAQIKDGVYIRASGNAPDFATQAQLLAAVSTIRVVR
jgi:hypothetical protein